MKNSFVSIRRMRPDETELLQEFLYHASICRREQSRRPDRWWIYRNCGSIPRASAHGPAISVLWLRWTAK